MQSLEFVQVPYGGSLRLVGICFRLYLITCAKDFNTQSELFNSHAIIMAGFSI